MAKIPDGLSVDDIGVQRCFWCGSTPDYVAYHDDEWGRPVTEDRRLFEKLCLEGFQSGLSWLTILRKRENFRAAFDDFDFKRIARYSPKKIESLLQDAGIVRHRGKIESTINNAQRLSDLIEKEGSLSNYVWKFEPAPKSRPVRVTRAALSELTQSPESVALSKDLKRRGWSFVGPTTVYSFMQAMGLVNDHIEGCWVRKAILPRN